MLHHDYTHQNDYIFRQPDFVLTHCNGSQCRPHRHAVLNTSVSLSALGRVRDRYSLCDTNNQRALKF